MREAPAAGAAGASRVLAEADARRVFRVRRVDKCIRCSDSSGAELLTSEMKSRSNIPWCRAESRSTELLSLGGTYFELSYRRGGLYEPFDDRLFFSSLTCPVAPGDSLSRLPVPGGRLCQFQPDPIRNMKDCHLLNLYLVQPPDWRLHYPVSSVTFFREDKNGALTTRFAGWTTSLELSLDFFAHVVELVEEFLAGDSGCPDVSKNGCTRNALGMYSSYSTGWLTTTPRRRSIWSAIPLPPPAAPPPPAGPRSISAQSSSSSPR